jgi:hypothetical protein
MKRLCLVVAALTVAVCCKSENSDGPSHRGSDDDAISSDDTGSETHHLADGDVDTDTDADGDGDNDTDSDADSDTDSDADSDTDSDADSDTDADTDSHVSSDTSTITMVCPDGTVPHTTSGGRTVCCSGDFPVFCDDNDSGYQGSCWAEGVDCETLTLCGGSWRACYEGNLPYCDDDDNFSCYSCDEDSTPYTTASGRPVCCSETRPLFCDENDEGYPGGCWAEGVACETLTLCDGSWLACTEGYLPFCDEEGDMSCHPCPDDAVRYETASGRPICCTDTRPLFCDENSDGYPGGCWSDQIDCDTIIPCGDYWSACTTGTHGTCVDGEIVCQ